MGVAAQLQEKGYGFCRGSERWLLPTNLSIRKVTALTSPWTKLSIRLVAQIRCPQQVTTVVQNKALWHRLCAGACAWRTVLLLKMPVLETSGISAVGLVVLFLFVFFTFLILAWVCITEQVVSSIETCLPFSREFKETTRCGKAPYPVLFSTCVFDKCSVQETVICYI